MANAPITVVGVPAITTGTGVTSILAAAGSIGDAILVSTHINSATVHIASCSANGAVTFTHLGGAVSGAHSFDLWLGVTTGNSESVAGISFTGSASIASTVNTYSVLQLTAGGQGTTWAVDGALGSSNNTSSSTTITYPSLTAAGSNEVYYGYALAGAANAITTGAAAGYTVKLDSISNAIIYNASVSGVQAPTSLQTSSTTSYGLGVLVTATAAPVGSIQQAGDSFMSVNSGTAVSTLALTTYGIGNLLLVGTTVNSATIHFSSLSGGGVTTWQHLAGPFVGTSGTRSADMWMGVVTATGSQTITGTGSGALTGLGTALLAQELTMNAPAVWAVDGSVATLSNSSSVTMTFPTLTPSHSGEIYFGVGAIATATTEFAGPTSPAGYTGSITGQGTMIWNAQATGAQSPTMTLSPAELTWTSGILISGTLVTGSPRLRILTQAVNRASTF